MYETLALQVRHAGYNLPCKITQSCHQVTISWLSKSVNQSTEWRQLCHLFHQQTQFTSLCGYFHLCISQTDNLLLSVELATEGHHQKVWSLWRKFLQTLKPISETARDRQGHTAKHWAVERTAGDNRWNSSNKSNVNHYTLTVTQNTSNSVSLFVDSTIPNCAKQLDHITLEDPK